MKKLNIALVGNPNVGKSTLFNRLTGHQQRIGNWPGKTVEIKEGKNKITQDNITFIDLPGVYSIEANSPEEKVANEYIEKKKPDCIIHVIDSTNLERNLYLTTQLLEKNLNVVLALNMIDRADRKGICIDEKKLESLLGVKAIKISSKKGIGIKELIKASSQIDNIEQIKKRREINEELGLKNKSLSPKHRYDVISKVSALVLKKPQCIKSRSRQIDKIVAHPILGLPMFLFIMWLVFQASFSLANPLTDLIEGTFTQISEFSTSQIIALGLPQIFASLISDGIIGGVGSVLVFLPNILLLFFFLLILEDSGYFARIALIMDSLMQKIGLEGKAFIPLVLGFGCNVPAIMASRVLDDEKERLITILINPFMSCSARFPIYVLFAGAFFAKDQGLVILSLYLIGIIIAIISAFILRRVLFKKSTPPSLLIELPPYRVPTFCTIARQTYYKGLLFLKKAGMFILSISLLVWFLASMPLGVEYASEKSLIGTIGSILSPALAPCGFGEWEPTVALIFGAGAKEVVVSTLGTLYGAGEEGLSSAITQNFTPLSAYSFMLFSLLYMPCFAALAAIRKETGHIKWALFSLIYTTAVAWSVSTLFYQLGLFFGFN
jgi:ferrous iron transport protein B